MTATAIVVLIVAVSVAFVLDQSQPSELLEKPLPGQTKIYVDADDVYTALVITGAIAIVLAGLLSWVIARRAVAPLGEALRIQHSFVADASHELRTPVTIIALRTEVLGQQLSVGQDPAAELTALKKDVHTLGGIITDLLLAASPADRALEAACQVAEVAADALGDLQVLAERSGVTLRLTGGEGLVGAIPAATFRRCVVVLVDNAIVHSPAGGSVELVVAAARRGMFETRVVDHGTGIVGIRPERVFDRFAHTVDSSSAGTTRTGFGIGLALVRDIADRYRGKVVVTQTSSAGTTFTLTLPLRRG